MTILLYAVFLTEELELDHVTWVDKVLVTLLLLLRDWLMAVPLHCLTRDPSSHAAIRTVFEVGPHVGGTPLAMQFFGKFANVQVVCTGRSVNIIMW